MGVRSSQEAKRVGLRKCSCSGEDERSTVHQKGRSNSRDGKRRGTAAVQSSTSFLPSPEVMKTARK